MMRENAVDLRKSYFLPKNSAFVESRNIFIVRSQGLEHTNIFEDLPNRFLICQLRQTGSESVVETAIEPVLVPAAPLQHCSETQERG